MANSYNSVKKNGPNETFWKKNGGLQVLKHNGWGPGHLARHRPESGYFTFERLALNLIPQKKTITQWHTVPWLNYVRE